MIEEIPGVKGLVARKLVEDPEASVKEIRAAALTRYPDVERLTPREFAARYVTPLKRRMSRAGPARRRAPQPSGEPRTLAPPSRTPAGSDLPLLDAAVADARRRPPAPRVTGTAASNGGPDTAAPAVRSRDVAGSGAPGGGPATAAVPAATSKGPGPPATTREEGPPSRRTERRSRRETAGADEQRSALQLIFFRLALELTMAETNAELVDVVGRLERYVDEAMKVAA